MELTEYEFFGNYGKQSVHCMIKSYHHKNMKEHVFHFDITF